MTGKVEHLTSEYLSELNIKIHVSFISGVHSTACLPVELKNLARNCNRSTLHAFNFNLVN